MSLVSNDPLVQFEAFSEDFSNDLQVQAKAYDPQAEAKALGIDLKLVPTTSGCDLTLSHHFYIRFKDFVDREEKVETLIRNSNSQIKVLGPTLEELNKIGSEFDPKVPTFKLQELFELVFKKTNINVVSIPHINTYLIKKICQIFNKTFTFKDYYINYSSDGYYLDSTKFISFQHVRSGLLQEFRIHLIEVREIFEKFIASSEFYAEIVALQKVESHESIRTPSAENYPEVEIFKNENIPVNLKIGDIVFGDFSPTTDHSVTLHKEHICLWDMSTNEKQYTLSFKVGTYPISVKISPEGQHFFCIDEQKRLLLWKFGDAGAPPKLLNVTPLQCRKSPNLVSNEDNLIICWREEQCQYISLWPFKNFNSIQRKHNIIDPIAPALSGLIKLELENLVFSKSLLISTYSVDKPIDGNNKKISVLTFHKLTDFEKLDFDVIFEERIINLSLSPQKDKLLVILKDETALILDLIEHLKGKTILTKLVFKTSKGLYFNKDFIAFVNQEKHLYVLDLTKECKTDDEKNLCVRELEYNLIISDSNILCSNVHGDIIIIKEKQALKFNLQHFPPTSNIRGNILTASISNPHSDEVILLDEKKKITVLHLATSKFYIKNSIVSFFEQLKVFEKEHLSPNYQLIDNGSTLVCYLLEKDSRQGIRKLFLYSLSKQETFFEQGSVKYNSSDRMRGFVLSEDAHSAFIITNFYVKIFHTYSGNFFAIPHKQKIPEKSKVEVVVCKGMRPKFFVFSFDNKLFSVDLTEKTITERWVGFSKLRSIALSSTGNFLGFIESSVKAPINEQNFSYLSDVLFLLETNNFNQIEFKNFKMENCTNFHFYSVNKLRTERFDEYFDWILNESSAIQAKPTEDFAEFQDKIRYEWISWEKTKLKYSTYNGLEISEKTYRFDES